jgi:hypothetical protein
MLRSIAARREPRHLHNRSALRCVSKQEGARSWLVLILRHARTCARVCGSACACALFRMRTTDRVRIITHHLRQPFPFPRRVFAPGFCNFGFATPNLRGGGAPRDVRVLARHPFGVFRTRQALRRRLASLGVGRPPPGALTVAILGRVLRFASPDLRPDRFARAPRTRTVGPGARGAEPPGTSGYQPPAAGRHSSLRIQVVAREHAPNERGWEWCNRSALCSQHA